MEAVQNVITNDIYEQLRSIAEEMVKLYMLKEKGEEIEPELKEVVKKFKSIVEMKTDDTCDPKVNTCTYVSKRGNSKGQLCEKPSKSQFCSKHTKRVFNFTSHSEDS